MVRSKVVDANGRPLRCYHGTSRDFSVFSNEDAPYRGGILAFFSTSPDFASDYASQNAGANVMPVYLRIENPFDFRTDWTFANDFWDETGGIHDRYESNRILMGLGAKIADVSSTRTRPITREQFVRAVKAGSWDAIEAFEFVEYLREWGYDGIVLLEGGAINYAVFEPTQIKSAFNKGSFDPRHAGVTETCANLSLISRREETDDTDVIHRVPPVPNDTNPS